MAAAVGVTGLALSFGPALPGYALLYRWVPLLQGVRGAARFGFLALVSVAVLAGFGVAALHARVGSRRWWPAMVTLIFFAVNAEALRAPMTFRPFAGIPRIYQSPGTRQSPPSRSSPSTRRPPSCAMRHTC
jgi:hypothetical protein